MCEGLSAKRMAESTKLTDSVAQGLTLGVAMFQFYNPQWPALISAFEYGEVYEAHFGN